MSVIIDRRLNDRNKSATNRARFLRRYKAHIKAAVSDMVADRSIRDMERGGNVRIPTKDISEPRLRHGDGGDREFVLPGNKEFHPGDKLKRPQGQGQGQGPGEPGEGGEGEDSFTFALSREEFMNLFFDDLELPRMARTTVGNIYETRPQRAGYTREGSPTNLSVPRTMRSALGRRIALGGAAKRALAELEARATENPDEAEALEPRLLELRRRVKRVPFLDDIDLRYRHRIQVPRPMSQAVMFCLMDVSASMDQHKKDLAKRFYTLLYLFLSRKYEHVEIVFIRHTDDADEVTEEQFFHDRKTGGTVVLSALHLMREIIDDRFSPTEWNIYGAQASDGDAFGADPEKSRGFLQEKLLPLVRHFAYVEVAEQRSMRPSTLSAAYGRIEDERFAMVKAVDHRDIYPVFRELFARNAQGAAA
ncbi:MAG: YeaH/YhbH family protein [Burkholderiaceae bacterium]